MPVCVCAVFDSNMDYISRFSGYVRKKKKLPVEFCFFTETDALESFLKGPGADMVVFSMPDSFYGEKAAFGDEEPYAAAAEFLRRVPSGCAAAVLADPAENIKAPDDINKYQSAEGIISSVTEILSRKGKLSPGAVRGGTGPEITGIYSFGHSDKAVNFALNLAQGGSGHKKALYINLARFSGLKERLDEPPAASLSDVIYYFKTGSEKLRSAIFAARGRAGTADVLLSPADAEDLDLIETETWPEFLKLLAGNLEDELVVIDFGESFKNLAAAFDMCGKVYLVLDKAADGTKADELRKYLEAKKRSDLFGRLLEADIGNRAGTQLKNMAAPENGPDVSGGLLGRSYGSS